MNEIILKILKVIDSCNTIDQFNNTKNWVQREIKYNFKQIELNRFNKKFNEKFLELRSRFIDC